MSTTGDSGGNGRCWFSEETAAVGGVVAGDGGEGVVGVRAALLGRGVGRPGSSAASAGEETGSWERAHPRLVAVLDLVVRTVERLGEALGPERREAP